MLRRIVIGGVILVILCAVIGAVIFGGAFLAGKPVLDAGNAFMQALRDSQYQTAFDMSDTSLQGELVSAEGLQGQIEDNNVKPSSWNLNSFNIQNDQASLTGTITFTDNKSGTAEVTMQNISGTWKVIGFNFQHS